MRAITIIFVLFLQFSCISQEKDINHSYDKEQIDLSGVNERFDSIFIQPCISVENGHGIYCQLKFRYNNFSYNEILSSLILDRLIYDNQEISGLRNIYFEYQVPDAEFRDTVELNENIVAWAFPRVRNRGKIYELNKYIVDNMTPNDIEVYSYAMGLIYKDKSYVEFERAFFYNFLVDYYNKDINDQRFSLLIEELINWARTREGETIVHFQNIKDILKNASDDPIFFTIEDEK